VASCNAGIACQIARKLAHEIHFQAQGTKDSERTWIAEAGSRQPALARRSGPERVRPAASSRLIARTAGVSADLAIGTSTSGYGHATRRSHCPRNAAARSSPLSRRRAQECRGDHRAPREARTRAATFQRRLAVQSEPCFTSRPASRTTLRGAAAPSSGISRRLRAPPQRTIAAVRKML